MHVYWAKCIDSYHISLIYFPVDGVLNDSCANTDDTCILQRVYPDHQFYSCCCKTDFCNTNVVFPSHLSVAHPVPTIHSGLISLSLILIIIM